MDNNKSERELLAMVMTCEELPAQQADEAAGILLANHGNLQSLMSAMLSAEPIQGPMPDQSREQIELAFIFISKVAVDLKPKGALMLRTSVGTGDLADLKYELSLVNGYVPCVGSGKTGRYGIFSWEWINRMVHAAGVDFSE